ncbi:CCA tRNA nucleotidyltransferase [Celeribacter marinus]|uniref:CCA tRNA nucleotidyltransferase n=1 Tax=Celeribacter marinus TaxID=1397108 RepID=UPI003F6BB0A6
MTKLTATWLDSAKTQFVLSSLADAGFVAYLVGGCVRNALLHVPVSDLDIATSARPEQVISLFGSIGVKVVPTGIDHGTVTLILEGETYEVTTFRKDISTDGRHATVLFSNTIHDDAFRRDFTMNALYCDRLGVIHDPVGGIPDLAKRHVRFIKDPQTRIHEDYLRILRFFRFYAWYGNHEDGVDEEGLAACAANVDGLDLISRERIGSELFKLLSAPCPETALGAMEQSGVLTRLLPGSACKILFALSALGAPLDPLMRLAALGGDNVSERLRLSKKQANQLARFRAAMGSSESLESLAYRHGDLCAISVAYLRAAMFETPMSPDWMVQISRGCNAIFPIRAADLPSSFEGADIGRALKDMERHWIDAHFVLSKSDLLSNYLGKS